MSACDTRQCPEQPESHRLDADDNAVSVSVVQDTLPTKWKPACMTKLCRCFKLPLDAMARSPCVWPCWSGRLPCQLDPVAPAFFRQTWRCRRVASVVGRFRADGDAVAAEDLLGDGNSMFQARRSSANSSAPIRPSVSESRTLPHGRRPASRCSGALTSWPRLSFACLKRSRSICSTANCWRSRRTRIRLARRRSFSSSRLGRVVS